MQPTIVTHPNDIHMEQLYEWLSAEEKSTGEGFFCNWNVIYRAFEQERLRVAVDNSEAIALLTWWESSTNAGIDILTVKPSLRRTGIGKLLVGNLIEELKRRGVRTVKIQSEPTSSENFWLSFGFVEDPHNPCERVNGIPMHNLYMIKELHINRRIC